MTDKTNFNYLALRGNQVDDMEFIEHFNLDPEIAYTNKLNEKMLEITEQQNIEAFTKDGMSMEEAQKKAKANRKEAEASLKLLLARNGLLNK